MDSHLHSEHSVALPSQSSMEKRKCWDRTDPGEEGRWQKRIDSTEEAGLGPAAPQEGSLIPVLCNPSGERKATALGYLLVSLMSMSKTDLTSK